MHQPTDLPTTAPNEKPTLILNFEDFCFWCKQAHKCGEIFGILAEIKQCHVNVILLVKNRDLAINTLKSEDYAHDNLWDCLQVYRDSTTKKQIIAKHIAIASNNRSLTGSKILGNQKKNPLLKLVVFDSDKELNKIPVNAACRLHVIVQKEDKHIQELKKVVEEFKLYKGYFENQKDQQISDKISTDFAEKKLNYHYQKAESAVAGEICSYLKFTKMQLVAFQAFTKVLPKNYFISDQINSWNIYDCLVQAINCAQPQRQWDIKEIKKKIVGYMVLLDANNDNWVKKKMQDDYTKFIQFLNLTDKELLDKNLEQGEVNYPWDQLEIDAVIICQLYKINIVVTQHIVAHEIKTLINEKYVETKIENNSENTVRLLINENGISKIDLKTLSPTVGSSVLLAVFDKRKIQYSERRPTKTKETRIKSDKYYTTLLPVNFLTEEMKIKLFPAEYYPCVSRVIARLDTVISERIKDCKNTHLNTLKLMPKFPKYVDGKYIWFNFNEGKNEQEELARLDEYLFNYVKQQKVVLIEQFGGSSNIIDYLTKCITQLEAKIIKLDEDMFENAQKVAEAGTEYEKNNDAQEEKKNNPRFTLLQSTDLRVVYDASAYALPDTIFAVCRRVAKEEEPLSNLIKAISDEKRRLGEKFDINEPEKFMSISDAQDDQHESLNQSPDKKASHQKTYRNLLEIACFYGNLQLVEWLVKTAHADVNYEGKLFLLFHLMLKYHRGMEGDSPRILPFLIECGIDPNRISKNKSHAPGGTFIHHAVALGSYLTIEYILRYVIQTNRGKSNIDIYKLSEPLPDRDTVIKSKTALCAAATHKDLKKVCDGQLGKHYKVLEQFFIFGVVFSSDEISYLSNNYFNDKDALTLIYDLINGHIKKYNKVASTSSSPINSTLIKHSSSSSISTSIKAKPPQLKTVGRWEVSKKEELEIALKLEDVWMTKLNLKKSTKPQLERVDSKTWLKGLAATLFSPGRKSSLPDSPESTGRAAADSPRRGGSEISPKARSSSVSVVGNNGLARSISTTDVPISSASDTSKSSPGNNHLSPRDRATSMAPAIVTVNQEELNIEQLNCIDDKYGFAAIHIATITGNLILFRYLQDKLVDLNLCSAHGNNIFYYAVKYQRHEIIDICKKLQLPLMPDKNKLIDTCKTPLHAAVENEDVKLTEEILDHAISTNTPTCIRWQDNEGHPPVIKAMINENIVIMKIFLKRGIWATAKEIENALDPVRISDRNKLERVYGTMSKAFSEHFAELNPAPSLNPPSALSPRP